MNRNCDDFRSAYLVIAAIGARWGKKKDDPSVRILEVSKSSDASDRASTRLPGGTTACTVSQSTWNGDGDRRKLAALQSTSSAVKTFARGTA